MHLDQCRGTIPELLGFPRVVAKNKHSESPEIVFPSKTQLASWANVRSSMPIRRRGAWAPYTPGVGVEMMHVQLNISFGLSSSDVVWLGDIIRRRSDREQCIQVGVSFL